VLEILSTALTLMRSECQPVELKAALTDVM